MKRTLLPTAWAFLAFLFIVNSNAYSQCTADFMNYNEGNQTFKFEDRSSSSGGTRTLTWAMGDGKVYTESSVIHQYADTGKYEVCLAIDDGAGCRDTICRQIHVDDYNPNNNVCKAEFGGKADSTNPLSVTLKSNATFDTTIVNYGWFVDHSPIGTTNEFVYLFAAAGNYEICHTIETASGCKDTVCQQVNIGENNSGGMCNPSFSFHVDSSDNFTLNFKDNSNADATINSWKWDLGDGTFSYDQNPIHKYTAGGQYKVCLEIQTTDSCTNSFCTNIDVGEQQSNDCKADFMDSNNGNKSFTFNDKSTATNGITKFSWNTGDGYTYNESNITHQYNDTGYFDVCLVIEGPQCVDTLCRQIHVDDYQQSSGCQPDFSFHQDSTNNHQFSFKDDTQSSDGNPIKWNWTFGDGNSSNQQNPNHTYLKADMYTVCLEIETDKGCKQMECDFVKIGDVSCHAEFGWDPTSSDSKEYKFSNYSYSDTTISTFNWDINGVAYVVENPMHTFSDTGEFKVTLIIKNVTGCEDTVTKYVHIEGGQTQNNCSANFSWKNASSDGSSFDFSDNSYADGGIKNWHYDMGDGYSYNQANFVHAYSNSGDYKVCLDIESNNGCADTICENVNVQIDTTNHNGGDKDSLILIQGCLATIWAEQFATDPMSFGFRSGSASADGAPLNHSWQIGGVNYNTSEIQHKFGAQGEQKVELTVSGSGCTSTAVLKIKVGSASTCGAAFTHVVDSNDANRVQFALSGTNNLTGGYWQFGDGKKGEQKDPIHVFPGPGFYDVCVNVYDSASGCQAQYCQPIQIEGETQGGNCYAQFDYQIDGSQVSFYNKSQGNYTKIEYKFGDGKTSKLNDPVHEYTATGVYDVCVNVFDSVTGCVAEYCTPITIQKDSTDVYCHANFDFFPIGDTKYKFANQSQGSFSESKWEFNGGANTIKNHDTEFEFAGAGHHEVCLNIYDETSGCFNSICKTIEIIDTTKVTCNADFSFFKEPKGKVVFNSKASGTFTDIRFDFGDGKFIEEIQANHQYAKSGQFNVCFSISDSVSGCQDQNCKMINITTDTSTVTCEAKMDGYMDDNGIAHAMNLSTGAYTHSQWTFGDGFVSNEVNPTHEFKKSGFYKICLNIFDSISGCRSEVCDEVNIQLDSADVTCAADFNFMVIDNEVKFNNKSVGSVTNAHWRFGDWKFSNNLNPVHVYEKSGVFPVCLDVWDSLSGCQASICKEVTIIKDVADVFCEAKFDHIQLTNGEIQFQNTSIGSYTNVHWDLGNGNFANHDAPIGAYAKSGVYAVSLTIRDSVSGCQDNYKEEIAIAGSANKVECHAKFEFFPVNDTLVKFKSVSQGDYTDIKWDFGDGKFAKNQSEVSHAYPHGGFFQVCVGIYDSISGCHDYACNNVELMLDTTVIDCHADFDFFPVSDSEVQFTNKSGGTYSEMFWKYGDGKVKYGANPMIDFTKDGIHEVCLTVFDSASGCQDRICQKVPIVTETTVYCDAQFDFFVDGKTVKLEPEVKGNVTGWVWDFDNGFNSNDSFPTYTFKNDGVYEVSLTVFDSVSGCFNTHIEPIKIITDVEVVDTYVKSDFSYFLNPNDGKVYFKDESEGTPNAWYWDFGDGDSAGVSQNPSYKYEADGYYEVCLTVKNENGGQETRCEVIAVGDVSDACYAKFDYYANAVTATAHFNNKSLGRINGYEWDFGDELNSIQYEPSHTYADTGFYPVCLTVTNDSGCVRTFCREIRVGNSLEDKCLIGCVWPGDANLDLEANHYDILPIGLHYGETGPKRDEVASEWRGYESQNWSKNLWGDVNNKHGDANGDGIIDLTDIEIVEQNFAYSHPWQPRATTKNQLSIDWDVDDIDVGETAVLTVSIPDSINVTMYGLGFEIDLDPSVFDYNSITYDFSNSFLGTQNSDLITFGFEDSNLGEVYIAESRNDHQEITGNGELVKIFVTAIKNSSNAGAVLTTEGGVTAEGDTVQFNGAEDGASVNSIEERDGYLVKDLVVFPNPTKGDISFNLPVGVSSDYIIDVYDNVGALVYSITQSGGGRVVQNLEQFNSGVYTIQVTNEKVKYMQKIILTK